MNLLTIVFYSISITKFDKPGNLLLQPGNLFLREKSYVTTFGGLSIVMSPSLLWEDVSFSVKELRKFCDITTKVIRVYKI